MNIASAKLLEDSLGQLADNFYRNRALQATMQEEAQRNAIEQSFRQAQMQHYNELEDRQQDFFNRQQQAASDRAALEAQNLQQRLGQQGMIQKQALLKTVMGLNATGQLTDDARKKVNDWLNSDPDLSKTGMQLQPAPNPSKDPGQKQSALVQAVSMIRQLRDQAASTADAATAAQLIKAADDLEDNLPAHLKEIPQTRISQSRDEQSRPAQQDDGASNPVPIANPTTTLPAIAPAGPAAAALARPGALRVPSPGAIPQQSRDREGATNPATNAVRQSISKPVPNAPSPTPNDNFQNTNGIPTNPQPVFPSPPQSHISFLQAAPSFAPFFDAMYGEGSSSQFLNPPPVPG